MAVVGLYLHHTLQDWTETRIQDDLHSRAILVADVLDHIDEPRRAPQLIDSLQTEPEQRITLVDSRGIVLADTALSEGELAQATDRLDRPEIQSALEEGSGFARRHSESVGTDLLYVAVMPDRGDMVVRVSLPLREVDEALSRLRLLLLAGGLLGLGIAIAMSSMASNMMSRTLQNVIDRARSGERATSGELEEVSHSLRDVTHRLEQTMDTLSNERDRFRAVIDGMSEGVVATDDEFVVTLTNRAAAQVLRSDEFLDGEPLSRLMPAEVIDELVAELKHRGEVRFDFETGGTASRCIDVRVTPRPDTDGYILVFHDVTTLRRLETMRRDFVANVSHELRTPVSVIQANAETLLDGALDSPEHAQSFTDSIHRHSERLSRLISELLDISRIEAGEWEFHIEPLDLRSSVDTVVEHVKESTGEEVQFDVDVAEELRVRGDSGALEQVLINLCENAAKYGGADHPITIRSRTRDDRVVVEVCDRGPGIAEEHRHRIFERFYRVDPGRSTEAGSTGLGLSIVKHLVTSMDGDVGYRPRDGGGSIFWFSLPVG